MNVVEHMHQREDAYRRKIKVLVPDLSLLMKLRVACHRFHLSW